MSYHVSSGSQLWLPRSALCRALGEYAASNKSATEQEAKELVAQAFGTLQDFDFELFQAIRNKENVSDAAGAKLQSAVHALDGLLATVPASELDKAKVRSELLPAADLQVSNLPYYVHSCCGTVVLC